MKYLYNNVAEKTAMVTPKGTFQYGRDAAGRLKGITNHKGEYFTFNYDLNNNLKQISTPTSNSIFTTDASGFNNQISYSRKSGATIERFNYTKDLVGNRLTKTTMAGTSIYKYDKNYQLVQSTAPNLPTENFSYDLIGNRTSDSNGNYSYDESGQKLVEDPKYNYVFDIRGNLSVKEDKILNGNRQSYNYNSSNQLTGLKYYKNNEITLEVSYTYDALGRRIEKDVTNHEDLSASFIKRFSYDANEILFELDNENVIINTYTNSTIRTDDVLALSNSQESFYFVKDNLGTITDITNDAGFIIQHHNYSSYGILLSVTDENGVDIGFKPKVDPYFSFTGREFDKESGLYYFRARYYDPEIGRFLTKDSSNGSYESPNSINNKYIYVENDPINKHDQNGDELSTAQKAALGYVFLSKYITKQKGVPGLDYGEWCGLEVAPAEIGKDPEPHNNLDRNCMVHDKELLAARDRRSIWEQGYGNPLTAHQSARIDFTIYQGSRTIADLRLGFNMLNHRNWDGKPLENPKEFTRAVVMGGAFLWRAGSQNFSPFDLASSGFSWLTEAKNGKKYINSFKKLF